MKQVSYLSGYQIRLGHLCLYRNEHDPFIFILVLMQDKSTDQIFDALTDQEYDLEEYEMKEKSGE